MGKNKNKRGAKIGKAAKIGEDVVFEEEALFEADEMATETGEFTFDLDAILSRTSGAAQEGGADAADNDDMVDFDVVVADIPVKAAAAAKHTDTAVDAKVNFAAKAVSPAPVDEADKDDGADEDDKADEEDEFIFEITIPADSAAVPSAPPVSAPMKSAREDKDTDDDTWTWDLGWEPEKDNLSEPDDKEEFVTETKVMTVVKPVPAVRAPLSPPPVFTKIAHVCLYVADLERSIEFYAKLGLKKSFAFTRDGESFGAYMQFAKDNFIELFEDKASTRAVGNGNGRLAHFCLETPDIDAVAASLTERGVEFRPKKKGCDSTYQIWLKDPDGNEFEIHQYTPQSAQLVGGTIEADW